LTLFVTGVSLLSVTAVFASGWPLWLKSLVALAVVSGGARWVYTEGLRLAPRSILRLVLLDEAESMVVERNGTQRSVRALHGVVIGASLAIVTLRCGRWRTRTICLFGDAMDADAFRRLRIRLNVSGFERAADGRHAE